MQVGQAADKLQVQAEEPVEAPAETWAEVQVKQAWIQAFRSLRRMTGRL